MARHLFSNQNFGSICIIWSYTVSYKENVEKEWSTYPPSCHHSSDFADQKLLLRVEIKTTTAHKKIQTVPIQKGQTTLFEHQRWLARNSVDYQIGMFIMPMKWRQYFICKLPITSEFETVESHQNNITHK